DTPSDRSAARGNGRGRLEWRGRAPYPGLGRRSRGSRRRDGAAEQILQVVAPGRNACLQKRDILLHGRGVLRLTALGLCAHNIDAHLPKDMGKTVLLRRR